MQKARLAAICICAGVFVFGCGGKKQTSKKNTPETNGSTEPDKVRYETALNDLQHNHYEAGRMELQVLINTYPDSEYLAKAKLAIADSYYKEGGTASLTQAAKEYEDFGTFFPFLDEAAYARYQIGMCHYRQLEKPDRDRTQARLAEDEFQTFLQKFPNSSLAPQAEQKLRDVQELLAEGDFRIARYYYAKGSLRASGARLLELVNRYPLYSQADKANWMLGQVFERAEKSDIAARFYANLVREYPLSPLVKDAKDKLQKLGVPVPPPDAEAMARAQSEKAVDRGGKKSLLKNPLGVFSGAPNLKTAARSGAPNLSPLSDAVAKLPEGPGPGMTVTGGTTSSGGGTSGSSGDVVVVPAGSAPPTGTGTVAGTTGASGTNPPATDSGTAGSALDPPPVGSGKAPATADPVQPPADSTACKRDDKSKKNDKNNSTDKPNPNSPANPSGSSTDDKSKNDKNCKESTSKKHKGRNN